MDYVNVNNIINDSIKIFNAINPCPTVTRRAREEVEQRLRAFPDICLRAREAEGMEALLLKHEIRIIKNALSFVSGNPYYRILPAMYFHVHTKRKVAENITCDQSTVHRNRNKMLGEIALRIYGVEAWVM